MLVERFLDRIGCITRERQRGHATAEHGDDRAAGDESLAA